MEGVKSAGANQVKIVRFGVIPQVLPVMLSFALYMFESNIRSATILGIVGAGGLHGHARDLAVPHAGVESPRLTIPPGTRTGSRIVWPAPSSGQSTLPQLWTSYT